MKVTACGLSGYGNQGYGYGKGEHQVCREEYQTQAYKVPLVTAPLEVTCELAYPAPKKVCVTKAIEITTNKMKLLRVQLEDADAQIDALQSKCKKAELQAEESEERAASAETALGKARQRAKAGQSLGASVAASRQRSRMRTPSAQD